VLRRRPRSGIPHSAFSPVALVTSLLCFEPSANPLKGSCGLVVCSGGFGPNAAVERDAGSNALSKGDTVPVLRTGHEVQCAFDEGSGDIESCIESVCLRCQRGSQAMPLRKSKSLQFRNDRFENGSRLVVIFLTDQRTVSPGWIEDSVLNTLPDPVVHMIRDHHRNGWTPMRRLGTPADIGNAITLLCSTEAGWITGQLIAVDGGMGLMDPALPLAIQQPELQAQAV
jgi:enoyl-ACP reductase-like protein